MAWLTTWLGHNRQKNRNNKHNRLPRLEQFEDRIVPAYVGPLMESQRNLLTVQPGEILFLGAGTHPDSLYLNRPDNAASADTSNVDQAWLNGGLGLNLTGGGNTVGVWEAGSGRIRNTHQEFGGRATDGDTGGSLSDHATHVAGTIAAVGVDKTARGMANTVSIRGFTASNDIAEMTSFASSMIASNHSYGAFAGWENGNATTFGLPGSFGSGWFWLADRSLGTEDPALGRYGASAVAIDTLLAANPLLLSVYSAGNHRNDVPTIGTTTYVTYFSSDPGGIGWTAPGWYVAPNSGATSFPGSDGNNGTGYDSINAERAIKNGLTIGAINPAINDPVRQADISMSNFSSWGPVDDGRVKPDLVADGVNMNSPYSASDSTYGISSGTSMAAPTVTGTAAVLVQFYQQQYGVRPTSATLRALMSHTAFDAGNVGPDYIYGWGVLDAAAAINLVRQAKVGSAILSEGNYTGSKISTNFTAKGGVPLKATIAWTDPAGTAKTGADDPTPVLVNDLDIYAVGPDSQVYHAWRLNPATPTVAATRAVAGAFNDALGNRVDNLEQVMIDAPIPGVYTLHVRHQGASFNQAYTMIVSEGGDRFERNETFATAAKIGVAPGINIDNLSIHSSTDIDWYRFEVLRSDSIRVKATFPVAQGNLDLQVTNSIGTVIASGTVTSDNEQLDVNGLAPGTYYVRVFGAGGDTNQYSLSITPAPGSTTKVYYVNDSRSDDGVYALAAGNDANDGLTPLTPKATVQDVLADYDLDNTSLVAIDTGTYSTGTVTVTTADEGAIFAGSGYGSNFDSGGSRFDFIDADFNILHGLGFTGTGGTGVYLRPGISDNSDSNRIISSSFTGLSTGIRLDYGSNNSFESNSISNGGSGIYASGSSDTVITGNTIKNINTGLNLSSGLSDTSITLNTITQSDYAIYLTGSINSTVSKNTLSYNGLGLYSSGNTSATVIGNTIDNNTTGIEGSGTFGGTSWSAGQFNDIYNNTTGVVLQSGSTVRFNRVHHNSIGISTANTTTVSNNEIFRNSQYGILSDGDTLVNILANTVYSVTGDALRFRNFSKSVTVTNNILHVENGYALYVTNDSQLNLVSDYNNLYSTGAGRPVWFQKEFADIFDWQVESGYDQHSIGRTAPAPTLDDPQYTNLAGDDYTLGAASTSIDAGDPLSSFVNEPGPNGDRINLGAHGNTALATTSKAAYLELNYPTYYTDWEFAESRPILWRGYNVGGNLSIDLVEEGSGTVRHIADMPVSAGSYTWIPSSTGGVSASITARHRIRITSIVTPSILTSSREALSITANTPDFYVNDGASGMDEYATAAGDNRKTGKTAGDPKSSLVALLRSYHLEPGDTVRIDAGTYNHVRNVIISGNLAIGDDEGATFQGATGSKGGQTVLDRSNTFNQSTNIELSDGDEVTMKNLILQGANRGLWVHNNSIRFDGFKLTTRNNAAEGLIIESDSEQTVVDQLVSHDNGSHGISISAGIGSLLNSQTYNNGGSGIILSGDPTVIRDIKTYLNKGTGLSLTGSGHVVERVESYNNYVGIDVTNSTGTTVIGNTDLSLAKGNRVHDNTYGITTTYGGILVVGNAITGNTTGVSVFGGGTIERNIISGGSTGVSINSGGIVKRNRIYNNTKNGIQTVYGSNVLENTIYSNGTGIETINSYASLTSFRNNLIYANTNAGITVSGYNMEAINNTIYQTSGDGLLIANATNNTVNNNIIWTTSGIAISVASDSQTNFASDYNLFRATGTGNVGRWQNVLRNTLNAWQNAAFTDPNTISQDPLFVDIDGADGMLGYVDPVNDGRDDNFHVQSDVATGSFPGSIKDGSLVPVLGGGGLPVMLSGSWSVDAARSPTLDRGNPTSPYGNEPVPNGGYIDLGAFGNTEHTSRSPQQYLLMTRPDGGEVWPAAQTFAIRWRAENFGGGNAIDFDGVDDYVSVPHHTALARINAEPVTLEAWIKPDNFLNYGATILAKGRTGGNESANYALRLGNGNYNDSRLIFYYRSSGGNFNTFTSTNPVITAGVWQHIAVSYTFGTSSSIKLFVNGTEVPGSWTSSTGNESPVSTTDPLWIGAMNGIAVEAVEQPFNGQIDDVRVWNVTRTPAEIAGNVNNALTGSETGLVGYWKFDETSGTALSDSSPTANHGTMIGGTRVASTPPLSRVDLELTDAGGTLVTTIKSATPNDGEYLWQIPESVTPGTNYKVRVRRSDMPAIVDSSNAAFEITEKISFYYVNDASIVDGNDLTSAPGNDGNDGLSTATPKASVRSVLETYDLGPGDVIIVDGGSYAPTTNIIVTSDDTGVTIRGNPDNYPTLNRGNTSSGAAVFQISGSDDITLENMTITGGYDGVWVPNSGVDRLTMRRLRLDKNTHFGLNALNGNTEIRFEDGIASNNNTGLSIYRSPGSRILNSDLFGNSYAGVEIESNGLAFADYIQVEGSRVRDNYYGIVANYGSNVVDNLVWNNTWTGVSIYGSGSNGGAKITGNRIWGQTNDVGLYVFSASASTIIEDNEIFSNSSGIQAPYTTATIRDNRIYNNSKYGINIGPYGTPVVGNTIFSNKVGIYVGAYSSPDEAIENNLIYGNSQYGIQLEAPNRRFVNNTIYQPTGDAIHFLNAPGATLLNNIIQVGSGTGLYVDAGSVAGLTANYDLIRATGGGKAADWEGVVFTDRAELSYETGQELNGQASDPAFVDVDGADNVLGYDGFTAIAPSVVQDDPAAVLAGTWSTDAFGFNGSQKTAVCSTDPLQKRTAVWSFTGLELNATYELAATWSPNALWSDRSRFNVVDSLGADVFSGKVNQRVAPADFTADGATWQRIGRIVATGTALNVVLDNVENSYYGSVAADGVRLVKVRADAGLDDNFKLQTGSPAIDAGDPSSAYALEPAPNGGRINLGHDGDTAEATTSPSKLIQVLIPTDIGKIEVGTSTTLVWRSFGLPAVPVPPGVNAAYDATPMAYYRLGDVFGSQAIDRSGNSLHGTYKNGVTLGESGINGFDAATGYDGIDDHVSLPAGFADFTGGMSFSVWVNPSATGTYTNFVDLGNGSSGDRIQFGRYYTTDSVYLNVGNYTATAFGAVQENVWQHFAVTMAADKTVRIYKNGTEIHMSVLSILPTNVTRDKNYLAANGITYFAGKLDEVAIYDRALTPTEVTALAAPANYGLFSVSGNVKLDLLQNGSFVQSITASTTDTGDFKWSVPAGLPTGTGYQVSVSTLDNVTQGLSASFRVVPGGTQYYVSTTGDNKNSGRSPAEPMRTVRALVNAYDLDAGDVVNVAAGTYRHVTNVIIGIQDSGVKIIGPSVSAGQPPAVTINRGNTTAGNAVFQLSGGDDVTIEDITATGAFYGVWIPAGGKTDGLILRRMRLAGNAQYGLYANSGNSATRFEDGVATGNIFGLTIVNNADSVITNSDIFGNSNTGVELYGTSLVAADRPRIENSRVRDNGGYGIYTESGAYVVDNLVWNNNYSGIYLYGSGAGTEATGNRSWYHPDSAGIVTSYLSETSIIENNEVFGNSTGISANYSAATFRNNRVYGNTGNGIYAGPYSTPLQDNTVYSNSTGIYIDSYNDLLYAVENNLVYGNTNYGIRVNAPNRRLLNNTVYQPIGDAIRLDKSPGTTLRNNILETHAGAGLWVSNDSVFGLSSDYNLYHTTGSGVISQWEGVPFFDRTELSYETSQEINSRTGDSKFVNVDGIDNVLGYQPAPVGGTEIVQDDVAATFSGSWASPAGGLNGTQRSAARSTDPLQYRSATWTFNGLEPNATYEVAVTWAGTSWNNSSRFFVRDSLGSNALNVNVNQTIAPSDFTADGADWKRLGRVVSLGTSLSVVLDNYSNSSSNDVVADGVRLVKLTVDGGLDDNFNVQGASPAIDGGDLGSVFSTEPAPNGGRINIGHTGNTTDATTSPSTLIQVLVPTDIGKVEVGAPTQVAWRNFGLPSAPVPPGLNAAYDATPQAYYRLGETAGIQAFDYSGNNNHAIYQNGFTLGDTGINALDGAARFDGIDDRLTLPSGFSDFTNGLSFSFWINPSSLNNSTDVYDGLIDLGTGVSSDRVYLSRYNPYDLQFHLDGFDLYTGNILQANVWQHLAVTVASDKTVRIFHNGTQVALGYAPAMPTNVVRTKNVIGMNGSYWFDGRLDEMAIYSRALSASEVTDLANTGKYGLYSLNGNVKLDLLQNGSFVQSITASTLNMGYFTWNVPGGLTTGANYSIRVSTLDDVTQGVSAPFRVVPGGNQYYVSTNGNNANSGRLPGEPMRSVRALVNAYDLDAGDVVNVAAGTYRHYTNSVLTSEDSGVRIIGPVVPTGQPPVVTINRGNTTVSNSAFQLSGADDVTIEDIAVTGGRDGIRITGNSDTENFTMKRLRLHDNVYAGLFGDTGNSDIRFEDGTVTANQYGIYFFREADSAVVNSDIFGNTSAGLDIDGYTIPSANRPRIENSLIHNNGSYGIYLEFGTVAENNKIYSNSGYGIYAYGSGNTIAGNEVYKQSTSSGIYSAYSDESTVIEDNIVFTNNDGISANQTLSIIRRNRVFGNTDAGIEVDGYGARIEGNYVYSNSIGIDYNAYSYASLVQNNLVYANTNIGIRVASTSNPRLINNTSYQPVGDAIRLENSTNADLYNNIAWSDAGYGIYVDSASKTNFTSDANLFHQGPGASAYLGFWGGTTIDTLADWKTATGQETHSVEGNPLFVDRDGPDNVLGYVTTGGGFDGGPDDNFVPGSSSPVIDRANIWNAPLLDITGGGRSDDPATANLGQDYLESSLGSSGFAATGTAQNWKSTNGYWNLNLPFSFPYYGETHSSVAVTTEGYLFFSGPMGQYDSTNTSAELLANRIIAPLWDNLRTDLAGDDIFIDNGTPNQTTIRWNATQQDSGTDVNFSVTLYSTGEVRFHFGAGNTLLTPTIGISRGDGIFAIESPISNSATLTNADSRIFAVGSTSIGFADIGAYEFRGNSNDTIPPQIIATNPPNIHTSGTVKTLTNSIILSTSEPLNAVSALAVAAYDLRAPGGDTKFGTGDDIIYGLTPSYVTGSTTVTLAINIPDVLAPGTYRLTAGNIFDLSGNSLDGDGNGMGGDNYVRTFTIANPGITVTPTVLSTNESGTTAKFSVVLETQPSANVTIPLVNGDSTEGSLDKSSLVFTSLNWDTPQFVTVTGVDDLAVDGDIGYTVVTSPAVTTDPHYSGFNAADVSVTNVDNDSIAPVVSGFIVNDGNAQRSRLTKIVVNFASPADALLFQTLGAVKLTRTGIPTNNIGTIGTVVDLSNGLQIAPASGMVSSITLTFASVDNAGINYGSLADGRWQMNIVPAGNYLSPNGPGDIQLRRLFGNNDNDTTVDATDFGFYPPFGAAVDNPFDFNNDGTILADDFGEFGNRFGFTLL